MDGVSLFCAIALRRLNRLPVPVGYLCFILDKIKI